MDATLSSAGSRFALAPLHYHWRPIILTGAAVSLFAFFLVLGWVLAMVF